MSPSDVAALVKEAVDIVDVVGHVVALRRVGTRHVGLCPFHQEKTASFHVDGENQFFHCFGCGAGGDVLTFVMRYNNLPFGDAVKQLADRYNIPLPQQGQTSNAPIEERNQLYRVVKAAADYFYEQLHHSPMGKEAREYMSMRALPSSTVESQRLGYAPNRWDGLLKHFNRSGMDFNLGNTAGLFIKGSSDRYYDRFRNRLIFPIADEQGKVVAFGGRSLDGSEPKYLNSPETPIYHKGRMLYQLATAREACRQNRQVVVVEGYMDLLAFHARGFYRVVATLGTALTPQQVRLLGRMADEVVLLYDADQAGEKAMFRATPLFLQEQLAVTCLHLPAGMDPDDFLKAKGLGEFEKLMQERQSLVTYVVLKALEKWDGTGSGKAKVLAELQPVYRTISQPVVRSECLRLLADRFALSETVLDEQLGSVGRTGGRQFAPISPISPLRYPQSQSQEEEIVRIMVKYPSLIEEAKASGGLRLFRQAQLRAIVEALTAPTLAADGEFDASAVYELLPDPELKALFTRFDMELNPYDSLENARLHLQDSLGALSVREEKIKPTSLVEALRKAEQQGDAEQARQLQEQIRNLHSVKKKSKDK